MRAEGSEEPPLGRVGIRWGKNILGKGNKAGCRVGQVVIRRSVKCDESLGGENTRGALIARGVRVLVGGGFLQETSSHVFLKGE